MPPAALRYVALDEASGYGEAARRLVGGLRGIGATVEDLPWPCPTETDGTPASVPLVAHLVPEHYPHVRERLGGSPFVAHTVWETDRPPPHWPALLNATDLVVVPCAWNRDVFAAGGVLAPIAVVPHVACEPDTGDGGAPLELPDDVVVFYTISRWDERKDVGRVVRAFLDAFGADDPVALVVKTDAAADTFAARGASSPFERTTAWAVAQLVRRARRSPAVRLEIGEWSPARIAGLHHRGDCFVSLSRGEGWGLGAFDAAAYGNPVVTTGWGGPLAYLDPATSWLVDYNLVPVHHPVPTSYAPDQCWADARHDDAVEALRDIAADPDAAHRRAAPLAARTRATYAAPVVARQFLDAVAACRA